MILSNDWFVTSTCLLPWGWAGEEQWFLILDCEKKIPKRVVVKLLSIIWDQDSRDPVSTDDISLDEALYIFLCDGS